MQKTFAPNNGRFKIKTDNGFSDFIGVTKSESTYLTLHIFYEGGSIILTPDHEIFVNENQTKLASELSIGDKILSSDGLLHVTNIIEKTSKSIYDVLEVEKKNRFFSCMQNSKSLILIKNCLYIDELGFVPAAEEFYESVYPTISSSDTSKVIITSTPKGLNFFYKMWIEAETGRNEYVAYDVKWFEHPDRDQAWYDSQVANLNAKSVDQEINCVAGDTKLNLNGESVTIKAIYDKYKKLNASDNKGVIYVQDVSYTIGK